MTPIIIFGCGGHSRSIADIILFNDPRAQILFIDEEARENERIFGFEVLSTGSFRQHYSCIVGIGDNSKRKEMFEKMMVVDEFDIISVISKTAYIGRKAEIEKGCFIGNYCHIGPEVKIGMNSILNNSCVIDHEVKIGAHCHIGPNATISGRSIIGDLVFIGVGATVIDKVAICSNTIVGAGATVVDNITGPGVYVGTPACRIE